MLHYEHMAVPLPDPIAALAEAGDFEGELRTIDALLKRNIPRALRDRLDIERKMALRKPKAYCVDREEALAMLREVCPDFAEDELSAMEDEGRVEFCRINGERRYLKSFVASLLKADRGFQKRADRVPLRTDIREDEAIALLKREGQLHYRFRVRGTLTIAEGAFRKNALTRVHLPVPKICAQQSRIELPPSAAFIARENAPQRTACFERMSSENLPFVVEYGYESKVSYIDLWADEVPFPHVLYPNAAPMTEDDLSEQAPHLVFTPYLRALAEELTDGLVAPLEKARAIYDYITKNVQYAYMRPYFLIENQSEYCAANLRGDCGIQSLLFIALCRISGIPARWQSGLAVRPDGAGCHDWAQFYLSDYGWLFCDPSYGGGANRVGNEERRRFYFGNLDPFRMVANSRYQADFEPPKQCDRDDYGDNQTGEAEVDGRGLAGDEMDTVYETLLFERVF